MNRITSALLVFVALLLSTSALAERFHNRSDHQIYVASAGKFDFSPSTHPADPKYYSNGWTGIAPGDTADLSLQYGAIVVLAHNGSLYQVYPGDRSRGYQVAVSTEGHNCIVDANGNTASEANRLEAFRRAGCPVAMRAYRKDMYQSPLFSTLEVSPSAVDEAYQRILNDLTYAGANIVVFNQGRRSYEFELHFVGFNTGHQRFNQLQTIASGDNASWFVSYEDHGYVGTVQNWLQVAVVGTPFNGDPLKWGFNQQGELVGFENYTERKVLAGDTYYDEFAIGLGD